MKKMVLCLGLFVIFTVGAAKSEAANISISFGGCCTPCIALYTPSHRCCSPHYIGHCRYSNLRCNHYKQHKFVNINHPHINGHSQKIQAFEALGNDRRL